MKANVAEALIVGTKYYGRVVAVRDRFCFVGDVRRGYETVAMKGDLWCREVLPMDAMVQIEGIEPDTERGEGYFRTDGHVLVMDKGAHVPVRIQEAAVVLRTLSMRRTAYHDAHAKPIDPAKVQKAAENGPFVTMLRPEMIEQPESLDMAKIAGQFLAQQFAPLEAIEVSFTIDPKEIDEKSEKKSLTEAAQDFRGQNMEGQAASLETEYENFQKLRRMLAAMHEQDALMMDSLVPIHHLVDILVTAPVWFIEGRDVIDNVDSGLAMDLGKMYFCQTLGSQEASWLYQIYNSRIRGFHRFSGRDIMKPRTRKLIPIAREVFDLVVIATPYHDIAGQEWQEAKWVRNPDPFLFGFSRYLPYAVLIDRWSGTGLFPNILDMIADTVDHLRTNGNVLENFPRNTIWYLGLNGTGDPHWRNLEPWVNGQQDKNTVLPKFASDLVTAFDEGRLFEFLRPKPTASVVPAPANN